MPLAFESESHGTVAFGFFNIESDMLLLERLFFFAHHFCEAVTALAAGQATADLPGWRLPNSAAVGDLHGAIAGVRLSGFIGATYRRWPFPPRPEDFKQSPRGDGNRDAVRALIAPFGDPETLAVRRSGASLAIAEYRFDEPAFERLVAYVDQGGYPRWRDEIRPGYVQRLREAWRARV